MIICVGLGNPGKEYERTRHNVGFRAVEELCRQLSLPESPRLFVSRKKFYSEVADIADVGKSHHDVLCAKPTTYMNDSGKAAEMLVKYHRLDAYDQLYVCHDDLDIPLGAYKIHWSKGPKVHNGLSSIYDHLGTKEFWHVRIGVDGREGVRTVAGKDYVLQPFTPDEMTVIQAVVKKVAAEVVSRLQT